MKIIMMIGLSGSGKSFTAEKLSKEFNSYEIISSDKIREELFHNVNEQKFNNKVFEKFHNNMREAYNNSHDVILDATNLSRKDRRQSLSIIKSFKNVKVIAYIMNIPTAECINNDLKRDRTVGEKVIYHQRAKFEIPCFEEGFDKIMFNRSHALYDQNLDDIESDMYNFNIDNSHHKENNLWVHCQKVLNDIPLRKETAAIKYAAKFHDYGDIFTKNIDEKGEAHYYQHHNVGTYEIMCHYGYPLISIYEKNSGKSDLFRLDTLYYINYHMEPFHWDNSGKAKAKFEQRYGKKRTDNLQLLHEADIRNA